MSQEIGRQLSNVREATIVSNVRGTTFRFLTLQARELCNEQHSSLPKKTPSEFYSISYKILVYIFWPYTHFTESQILKLLLLAFCRCSSLSCLLSRSITLNWFSIFSKPINHFTFIRESTKMR